jgi:hypothetical protein
MNKILLSIVAVLYLVVFGFVKANAADVISKREIIIKASFFQVSPPPHPSELLSYGISTSLKANRKIVKDFGEATWTVHVIGNMTAIEHIKRFIQEVKLQHPEANYMTINRIQYIITYKGLDGVRLAT